MERDVLGEDGAGLTRREALKKGLIFGGTLLWSAPVVQTVGMTRALAAQTSGDDPTCPCRCRGKKRCSRNCRVCRGGQRCRCRCRRRY